MDSTDYECSLWLKKHRGHPLTPEEQRRLDDADSRFYRDFWIKVIVAWIILSIPLALYLYNAR
jgi:hypothetical protein